MNPWQALTEELKQSPQPINFWWRDDDAGSATPELDALLSIQTDFAIPLYLAVIPESLLISLPARIYDMKEIWVLQHGFDHQSHAKPQQRKIELGGTQQENQLRTKLNQGKYYLQQAFQQQFLPVMVPPWNRLDDWAGQLLPECGFKLLSALNKLKDPPYSVHPRIKLPNFPVHIDIMDWPNQCYAGDEVVISALITQLRKQRPHTDKPTTIGLMTHHLVHDPACNDFLRRFFDYSRQQDKIQWLGGDISRFAQQENQP